MGLIDGGASTQPLQQSGNVKPPAHQPEAVSRRGLGLKQVIQERVVCLPLAIGHHLRRSQASEQTGCLQGNTQTTTTKAGPSAWHQNPNSLGDFSRGRRGQAATASVLPAR